jgi:serine protease
MPKRFLTILALLLAVTAHAGSPAPLEGRVIVKYRESASPLKQAQSLERTARLAGRLGVALRSGVRIDARTEVIRSNELTSEALAARLSGEADVEYAVPDRLRSIRALPNDPLFSDQWYLGTSEAAAIRATTAWDQTTGSANVVIAIVDTGVRFDHPDLSAKLLPGHDFISDAANAGDGDGRDADASDPGDFISAAETSDPSLQAVCGSNLTQQSSSWHGTRVAGIAGAAGNNSIGIAGTSWGAKILPVRVLGKCGGYDSDILAGMRWAAGLPVPGVAGNPNPAIIINLSLGGSGSCTFAYASTIAELATHGVLVVASAGNETGPVETPGNCAGVLAVAGVRHVGTKVGYSSLGPEVSVSAPAGNCVNSFGPCLYSINTTTNLGSTNPGANNYTDANNHNVGTSFSAPQTAGVVALMLSLNPALSPADIITRIKQSARAFPSDITLPTCPTVATSGDTTGQCNCTTTTCGAGILDAAAAVAAALSPTAAIQALDPLVAGTQIRLDGSGSMATSGRTIAGWHWTLVSSPPGAGLTSFNAPTTSLQAPSSGSYTVSLTITDNLGASSATQTTLAVVDPQPAAPAVPPPAGGGGGGGTLDAPTLLGLTGLAGLAYLSRRRKTQRVPPR